MYIYIHHNTVRLERAKISNKKEFDGFFSGPNVKRVFRVKW